MNTDKPLVNRVANSGLLTINLEQYYPEAALVSFDLKDYLYKELILREKDFRAAMKEHDWSQYQDQVLLVYCSADAIIPMWAYMLIAAAARPYTADIFQGDQTAYLQYAFRKAIDELPIKPYQDQRVVIKGCSDKPVPAGAYTALTAKLQPHAKSIMFGEPCSTVPIFKQPRK